MIARYTTVAAVAATLTGTVPDLSAFVVSGAWPNGDIPLVLQLDAAGNTEPLPAGGLSDGSANWNDAVLPAIDEWNEQLVRSRLTFSTQSNFSAASGDNENALFFASDILGEPFGDRVLAVAMTRRAGFNGLRHIESDIIFNAARDWDSYRGSRRSSAEDVRRVALHEIGHLLGLLHPDEDLPAQSVPAIMNSEISNLDSLQPDDIDGANALYDTPLTLPVITRHPLSRSVKVGGDATLTIELDGGPPPPPSDVLQYAWIMDPVSASLENLFTFPDGNIPLGAAQLTDAGTYTVHVESPQGEVTSQPATIAVAPVANSPSTRLASIATRGHAGSGENALIVGFAVGGTQTRRVLVRGIGPAMIPPPFNVSDAVEDPDLRLFDSSSVLLASNDNWDDSPDAAELEAAFAQSGAFHLPVGAGDAALIADLPPGAYTAMVQPASGAPGNALVEVYDLSPGSDQDSRLLSLSTRGPVGDGFGALIAGFSVSGSGPRTYLLRAAGDTLGTLGVAGYLDDPLISLYTGSTRLRWIDDWDSPAFLQPILGSAASEVFAFQFVDRQESAMLVTLNPGLYTLVVSGFDDSSGITLVEVYEMP